MGVKGEGLAASISNQGTTAEGGGLICGPASTIAQDAANGSRGVQLDADQGGTATGTGISSRMSSVAAAMTRSPVGPILQHLRSEPSRTWSIVITVFGDAVVPRGGSLWLGSLLGIFAGLEIGGGVVRTAMSRLAADEWLQRNRVGRNSFYSLTGKGRANFAVAAERIYGEPSSDWNGRFQLVLPGNGTDRDAVRGALESSGFGGVAPGVWIAPLSTPVPPDAGTLMRMEGVTDLETARQLAERAWPLAQTAEAYRRFLDAFAPLQSWIAVGGILADLDALVGRILLVHEYRRVVLRDPLLPPALLPQEWPGTSARQLCSEIYKALLPKSEHWLDQNGRDEDGPLPQPSTDLHRRFGPAPARSAA